MVDGTKRKKRRSTKAKKARVIEVACQCTKHRAGGCQNKAIASLARKTEALCPFCRMGHPDNADLFY